MSGVQTTCPRTGGACGEVRRQVKEGLPCWVGVCLQPGRPEPHPSSPSVWMGPWLRAGAGLVAVDTAVSRHLPLHPHLSLEPLVSFQCGLVSPGT